MKKILCYKTLIIIACIIITPVLLSWGALAHEHINHGAVLSLPMPLQTFFYNHIDFITTESTVPDLRKYLLNNKDEDPKHYVDLENFGSPDSLPVLLAKVKAKYSEEFLMKNGTLPWQIEDLMDKLTRAFKEKKKTEILFLAADLGHYIGDAHTPLHTTVNYDGQLTNQKGIHSLWETRIFKMFHGDYNYYSGEAVYIKDIHKEIWQIINASHILADSVLLADKELRQKLSADIIYEKDSLGNIKKLYNSPLYSDTYTQQLNLKLDGMVEKQIRASIKMTASFWYTAWVNAGKPDSSDLDPSKQTERNKKQLKKELKLFKLGKLGEMD